MLMQSNHSISLKNGKMGHQGTSTVAKDIINYIFLFKNYLFHLLIVFLSHLFVSKTDKIIPKVQIINK